MPIAQKELFPAYSKDQKSRALYASAVYVPAQDLIDRIFKDLIHNAKKTSIVMFTAGGPGSGKSALIASLAKEISDAAAAMDGTMSGRVRAFKNLDSARLKGLQVAVYFVYRRFDDAVQGVIERAISPTSGRTVPMRVVAVKHYGALHTFAAIHKRCRKDRKVALKVLRFVSIGKPLEPSSTGEVIRNTPKSLDPMIKRACHLLDERFSSASARGFSFPRCIYDRLRAAAPSFRGPRG